jgi:predicted membrane metal-binding protein
VGLVAVLALSLFTRLRLPRFAACVCTASLVWAFALFSGGALPALRAASMTSAALSWNTLGLAAIASVALPLFWLSFCCVAAIFACASELERRLERFAGVPHRLREALVLTTATQLGTWPVTAAVFLQFTPYAPIANLAVVPCVPVTMLLGALQLALFWCAPFAQLCIFPFRRCGHFHFPLLYLACASTFRTTTAR